MSGGHFDYQEFRIDDIVEALEHLITGNGVPGDCGWCQDYDDETIRWFKQARAMLLVGRMIVHNIDYLVSGDTGEDTFNESMMEDSLELLTKYPDIVDLI